MDLISTNMETIAYIESETEFNRAKMRGVWEVLFSRMLRRKPCLLSFSESVQHLHTTQIVNNGIQDVPIANIVGSVSRDQDFTRHFLPCGTHHGDKERWRRIYTRAVTGTGFPPVVLYKTGSDYFVEDGHHRISVAKYLAWDTIQAHVIEIIPLSDTDHSISNNGLSLGHGVALCR